MKKIILLAAFGAAGLVSAKNGEIRSEKEKKEVKETSETSQTELLEVKCINYGLFIPCTEETLPDSVCYGEGTGVATYEDAVHCMTQNELAAIDFFC